MVLPGWSIAGEGQRQRRRGSGSGFPAIQLCPAPGCQIDIITTAPREGGKNPIMTWEIFILPPTLQGTVFNWAQRVGFACRTHQRNSWVRSCRAPAQPGATSCKVLAPSAPHTHPQDLHAATNQRNPFAGALTVFFLEAQPP